MNDTSLPVEFDEKRIDAIFASLNQCHLPGAAVGIAIAGRPVYRKGFGLANMEVPLLLSPSTRMRIHSTTKHFTCLAYMLLCEEGRAGVDDPLGKYFPELHPVARSVTMRQLMGNMGGLRNPMNLRWELGNGEREIPVEELLEAYRDIDDVNFAPGATFNYNNSGFELVGMAVERITGEHLEDVLRARIFEPVGMDDTMLRRLNSDFVPCSATMHTMNAAGQYEKTYLPGALAGAGGIVSTVDDMLRWLKHMDAPVVGSADTWTRMKTPQVLTNGTSTHYGFGLWKDAYRGVETIFHAGGGMGANSQMRKVPGARLDVAVMVNRSDISAEELAERILDACLPGLDPMPVAPARETPTGVFRSRTSSLLIQLSRAPRDIVFLKKGQPLVTINGMDCPFAFDAAGALRPTGGSRWMRYSIEILGEVAKPHALRLNDYGNVHMLEPLEQAENADTARIVGRYVCKALGTEAEVSRDGSDLRLEFNSRMGSIECKLASLAEGIWTSTQIGIIPRKSVLFFDEPARAFRYVSPSTHYSPLRFERR